VLRRGYTAPRMNSASSRSAALHDFVAQALSSSAFELAPASADASFRSYWRVSAAARTLIVMDAPPPQEDVRPWLDIGARLRSAGLQAPEVFAADAAQGFVLMEDLGTRTYLPELNEASVDTLYGDALYALERMQREVDARDLPVFDVTRTIPEMELCGDWFLRRHLDFTPTCDQWDIIEYALRYIANAADEQPRRFMHRDYHSRNLLVADQRNPGSFAAGFSSPAIIDFQGAMLGPITYDLASLLRDCYIAWPIERVDAWVGQYRQRLVAAGIAQVDRARFRRWFDLTGLQRHIKVLGLFCRLCYRDGKPSYLADLPLVLDYVLSVGRLHPPLVDFCTLLQRAVGDTDLTRIRAAAAT
jgi:aminoglycoside/choline kinase family phosphotransferase